MNKYPKTKQLRHIHNEVRQKGSFVGLDKDGNAMFSDVEHPKVKIKGTVKVHGTNCSVVIDGSGDTTYQSRNRVISIKDDHCGFVQCVSKYEADLVDLAKSLDVSGGKTVTIYGEWAGSGIQKGVAVSNIERTWFVFAIQVGDEFVDIESVDISFERIYNIYDFRTFEEWIDFNDSVDDIMECLHGAIEMVDTLCPVGWVFGSMGHGEGIVWQFRIDDLLYRFKTKGESHTKKQPKVIGSKAIDVEQNKIADQFARRFTPSDRMEQMIIEVVGHDIYNEMSFGKDVIPDFIKAVRNDIEAEEYDLIKESNVDTKLIFKKVDKISARYVLNLLNDI